MKISDLITDLQSNDELVELINEMYDFRVKGSGSSDCPKLSKLYEENQNFQSKDMLYDYVLQEASNRFDKVVIELFLKYPDKYLRRD